MTWRDHQSRIDRAAPAVVTPQGVLHHGALTDRAARLAGGANGRRIALIGGDPAQVAVVLAAAEGRARAVALISAGLPEEQAWRLLALSKADTALVDAVVAPPAGLLTGLHQATTAEGALSRLSAAPPAGQTDWLMTTSGTTGTPRMVRHTLAGLARTIRLPDAKAPNRTVDAVVWGLMYDHTRFAGLQVLLQALLSGACLAAPPLDWPLSRQVAFLCQAGCSHLSATPTLWRKLLMTPETDGLSLRQITLGGEIADDTLLAALANRFPRARVSHIFASTEAGVAFSVHDGRAGFPASYLYAPPGGIELAVRHDRLWVRNEHVQPDYLGGDGVFGADGWIDTGDQVTRQGDRLLFRGRASGAINVGGTRVHPEEVEMVLLAHPGVAAARVFARANPITGALVAAEVVPKTPDDPTLRADLMTHLRDRLDRHAVPVTLTFVPAIPTSGSGKIPRTGLCATS